MTKLRTKYCYSIIKLKRSSKSFPEFSLNALIFRVLLDFLTFHDFSVIFQGKPECCEHWLQLFKQANYTS